MGKQITVTRRFKGRLLLRISILFKSSRINDLNTYTKDGEEASALNRGFDL